MPIQTFSMIFLQICSKQIINSVTCIHICIYIHVLVVCCRLSYVVSIDFCQYKVEVVDVMFYTPINLDFNELPRIWSNLLHCMVESVKRGVQHRRDHNVGEKIVRGDHIRPTLKEHNHSVLAIAWLNL